MRPSSAISFGLLAVAVAWTYGKLPHAFFQQDEWRSFGLEIYANSLPLWESLRFRLEELVLPSGRPFAIFANAIEFQLWGITFTWYAYMSQAVHLTNTWLVFLLGRCLTGSAWLGLAAGLLFGVGSAHHQAVTWAALHTATQASLLCSLAALLYSLGIRDGTQTRVWPAIGLLTLGLGFKEEALGFLVMLPLSHFLLLGHNRPPLRAYWPVPAIALFYMTARLLGNIGAYQAGQFGTDPALAGGSGEAFIALVHRAVTIPLKLLAQGLIPPDAMISTSQVLVRVAYPTLNRQRGTGIYDQLTQTAIVDGLSYLVALGVLTIVALTVVYFFRTEAHREARVTLLALLLIIVFGSLFATVPGTFGGFSLVPSRYLYAPAFGTALLITMVSLAFARVATRAVRRPHLASALALILVCPLAVAQARHVRLDILPPQIRLGELQRLLLRDLVQFRPSVHQRALFYVESNTTYFGQSKPLMPFQFPFAYLLLTIYSKNLDPSFLASDHFWQDFYREGYVETSERGFGYFHDIRRLALTLRKAEGQLSLDDVYGFRWNGEAKTLTDITNEVREKFADGFDLDPVLRAIRKAGIHTPPGPIQLAYFDLQHGLNIQPLSLEEPRVVNGQEDRLSSARGATHDGWVGALLTYHVAGNGSRRYTLPSEAYGYQLVQVMSLRIDGRAVAPETVRWLNSSKWEITLPEAVSPAQTLEVGFMARVYQLDLLLEWSGPGRLANLVVQSAFSTRVLQTTWREQEQSAVLQAPGPIVAVANFPQGRLVAYVDGHSTPVTESERQGTLLTIRFNPPPSPGSRITVPVMVREPPPGVRARQRDGES